MTLLQTAPTYDEDYYAGIWGEEYDDYQEDEEEEEVGETEERINWGKYGGSSNSSGAGGEAAPQLPDSIYCDLVTTLNSKCVQTSLLEIWRYKEELVRSADMAEILEAVNTLERSPWYGYDTDYSALLGGVERDTAGRIVAARVAQLVWTLRLPDEFEIVDSQGGGLELEPADSTTLAWEQQFIQIVQGLCTSRAELKRNVLCRVSAQLQTSSDFCLLLSHCH